MKRKAFFTLSAIALLALPGMGAWASSAPFGYFGGLVNGGNSGNGVVPIYGWALATPGIFAVDIVVDGAVVGRANYGRSRPGVTKEFPGYPNSAEPGFAYELDTTQLVNGLHTVSARMTSATGAVAYTNSLVLQFTNTNADLLPFGKIEFPNEGAEMIGQCDLSQSRIWSIVSGYALDVNAPFNEPGVAYVELLIDGSILYNSQVDCQFLASAGGDIECYGIKRLDLEPLFPDLKDAPHAGFRFALDIGELIGTQFGGVSLYPPGSHELSIRVGDQFENVTQIAAIATTFNCIDDTNKDQAIGGIDQPTPGLLYGGLITVSGWAVDFEGVAAVLVYVDGNLVQFGALGLQRPDIVSEYPNFPANPAPGWYTFIDTTQLSNGVHELEVQVVDNNDVYSFIGKRPFNVENPQP
jgi:Bacterial Ig domain